MKKKSFFTEWVIPVISALLIAYIINKFVFFNVTVPTSSMYPTITPGDRMVVTRIYNLEKLVRGDIVVFDSDELDETLIKRLIGLPGDNILIEDSGKVFINGQLLEEPYVLNSGDAAGSFKVPENSYFFLGDNRGNSKDARYWKEPYIDGSKIRGKARFIIYPFDRFGKFKIGEEAL
ncbi:signal peptidase I [Clostridium sp. DL1XJH146]